MESKFIMTTDKSTRKALQKLGLIEMSNQNSKQYIFVNDTKIMKANFDKLSNIVFTDKLFI